VVKGDLNTEVISKEFEGGATISACFDKEETNCNLEDVLETDVHDVEEIQMMDDDVLPIAHEILAESKFLRDEVELSKSHNPRKPLTSIPINKEKYPSKSPCIAEAFAAARNARKHNVISGGARGDQNERLDAANGSGSAKEKDSVVVAGDTSALKKGVMPQEPSTGLQANDNASGDAAGKEGTTSGWTQLKDVQMPFPLGMQADPLMKDMPPLTRLSRKVLVLDMNGVLLRRYPYPSILDQQISKVFFSQTACKGGGDRGTLCITRPNVCDFLRECADIFHLCIWSSYTNKNRKATLKGYLFEMHPRIWKEQLSQTKCGKLPFKIFDVKELQGGKAAPLFVKGT
ncbi:hypothetical protein L7F22_066267, partial [Adiantum nelumboides]|nr:hypothetical protein [Adiantum nelumboides]